MLDARSGFEPTRLCHDACSENHRARIFLVANLAISFCDAPDVTKSSRSRSLWNCPRIEIQFTDTETSILRD